MAAGSLFRSYVVPNSRGTWKPVALLSLAFFVFFVSLQHSGLLDLSIAPGIGGEQRHFPLRHRPLGFETFVSDPVKLAEQLGARESEREQRERLAEQDPVRLAEQLGEALRTLEHPRQAPAAPAAQQQGEAKPAAAGEGTAGGEQPLPKIDTAPSTAAPVLAEPKAEAAQEAAAVAVVQQEAAAVQQEAEPAQVQLAQGGDPAPEAAVQNPQQAVSEGAGATPAGEGAGAQDAQPLPEAAAAAEELQPRLQEPRPDTTAAVAETWQQQQQQPTEQQQGTQVPGAVAAGDGQDGGQAAPEGLGDVAQAAGEQPAAKQQLPGQEMAADMAAAAAAAAATQAAQAAQQQELQVVPQPAEPQPADPQPADAQPVEQQPAEAQPAEPQPLDVQPAEPQPVGAQLAEAQPAEPQPLDVVQPAEPQPVEAQPAEAQPAEPQPAEVQPTEPQPAEAQPTEPQPAEAQLPAEPQQPGSEQPAEGGQAEQLAGEAQLQEEWPHVAHHHPQQQQQQQAAEGAAGQAHRKGGWQRPTTTGTAEQICEDTCPTARNGHCDDGRPYLGAPSPPLAEFGRDPNVYYSTCDLGTDCTDCGPWTLPQGTDEQALHWHPVADIRAKEFTVNVRQTAVPQPFWMAYTDPAKDLDLSRHLHNDALMEGGITSLWYRILKHGCVGPNGERRLVLDVGANFGYYTLLAASMGCRVIAWEPVPYFASFLRYGLLRNNFTDRVQIRTNIVGDEQSKPLTIVVPQRGMWGTAGINGLNIDKSVNNEGDYDRVERTSERIDEVVHEDVLLMKLDVEGFEPWVLKSAAKLLLHHKVDNILMEYSPGVAERQQDWGMFAANPANLIRLLNSGYSILHLGGMRRLDGWNSPLPPLETVTKAVLKHDLEDAYRLKDGTLGCPLPPELQGNPGMWGCNSLPDALHPHSFKSTFGHNTHLWAVREGSPSAELANLGPPASLFPLDYNVEQFFSPHDFGAARRPCSGMPPEVQVRHRCHCTDLVKCGELEATVLRLAAEGKMPPQHPPLVADVDALVLDEGEAGSAWW